MPRPILVVHRDASLAIQKPGYAIHNIGYAIHNIGYAI